MALSEKDRLALDFLRRNPTVQKMLDFLNRDGFEKIIHELAARADISAHEAEELLNTCVEYGMLTRRSVVEDIVRVNFSSSGRQLYTIFVLQRAAH